MQNFVCFKCGCVDTVDLAFGLMFKEFPILQSEQLCTYCQSHKWHGIFPRELYNSDQDLVINRPTGIGLS